jgi:hypothetical protein
MITAGAYRPFRSSARIAALDQIVAEDDLAGRDGDVLADPEA